MAPSPAKHKIRTAVAALLASLLALQAVVPFAQALSIKAPAVVKSTSVVKAATSVVKTPSVPVKTSLPVVKAPSVSLKTPVATVTTPAIAVKGSSLTVAAPTVTVSAPVKAPSVPVKAPSVSVKAPSVTATAPTVTAKAPTVGVKTTGVAVKAPTVQVKANAPAASVKGQSVTASGTPSVRVSGTAGSATVGVAGKTSVSVGGRTPASTGASPASPGSSAGGGSAARLGAAAAKAAAALLPGYGQPPGARPLDSGPASRYGGRLSPRERAIVVRAGDLRATVARLQGCLSELPRRGRIALQLSTGVGVSRALLPRAVAARLHVGLLRLTRIEVRALRELRTLSRTHSCTSIGQAVSGMLAFIGAGFAGGGEGGMTGGSGAQLASYTPESGVPRIRTREPSSGGWLLAGISPVATGMLLLLTLMVLTALTVGAILADSAGQGPRHWQWRRRIINRIRWLR